MCRLFVPDEYHRSVFDLDLGALRARGIRGLIFDLDNTLVRWSLGADPAGPAQERLAEWFAGLRAAGFRACIVSNNRSARVEAVARALSVPAVGRAGKPRRGALRRALAVMGTEIAETALVGDQVLTDVCGARRLGLYAILVEPLSRREFLGTRLLRVVEARWLDHLRHRGLLASTDTAPGRSERPR
ncbi:MAG: YqeG family HAD IIIA-type phosphatase [Clostridia bacterium]|nr:YqeG family HAD IIIA-type phosphatase [Clostridia bacterium]